MNNLIPQGAFLADGTPVFCPECGNVEFEHKNYYMDYYIVEVAYHCVQCRCYVAHWAYGAFDPAFSTCGSSWGILDAGG